MKVPEELLTGNHQDIARWKQEQSLKRTRERRQDLLDQFNRDPTGSAFLERAPQTRSPPGRG